MSFAECKGAWAVPYALVFFLPRYVAWYQIQKGGRAPSLVCHASTYFP